MCLTVYGNEPEMGRRQRPSGRGRRALAGESVLRGAAPVYAARGNGRAPGARRAPPVFATRRKWPAGAAG